MASARQGQPSDLQTIQPKSTITTMDEEGKTTVEHRFKSIMQFENDPYRLSGAEKAKLKKAELDEE